MYILPFNIINIPSLALGTYNACMDDHAYNIIVLCDLATEMHAIVKKSYFSHALVVDTHGIAHSTVMRNQLMITFIKRIMLVCQITLLCPSAYSINRRSAEITQP